MKDEYDVILKPLPKDVHCKNEESRKEAHQVRNLLAVEVKSWAKRKGIMPVPLPRVKFHREVSAMMTIWM